MNERTFVPEFVGNTKVVPLVPRGTKPQQSIHELGDEFKEEAKVLAREFQDRLEAAGHAGRVSFAIRIRLNGAATDEPKKSVLPSVLCCIAGVAGIVSFQVAKHSPEQAPWCVALGFVSAVVVILIAFVTRPRRREN